MRIVYIGADGYANCAMALLNAGHQITHLFWQPNSRLLAPVTIHEVAKRAEVRPRRAPVTRADIEGAIAGGAEAVVCAIYASRLPISEHDNFPAVNIHPSPLPEGRGPAPYEWAILTGRTETAVTVHQIVERFDAGPILVQRPLAVRRDETSTSLAYRCSTLAAELAVEVFADFERLWRERRPQGSGTYCKLPRRADRTLDWASPREVLDRQLRAFPPGRRYGVVAGRTARLGQVDTWQQHHDFPPGALCTRAGSRRLITTLDGFAEVEEAAVSLPARARRLAWPVVKRMKAAAGR